MRAVVLICFMLFLTVPAYAGGPEDGELLGIQLGMPINPDSFIDSEIYRFERAPPFYDFIDKAQKLLKLNEKMKFLGLQRASVDVELESLKVHSIDAESNYKTWEEVQFQANFVCKHFSQNYGGECKDVLQLDPEELLADSLWPVEVYYNDFGRTYALILNVGRRRIPGTQGEIENSFSIGFEIFRDRYQECLDSYTEPDDFGFYEGREPYIECADLKR